MRSADRVVVLAHASKLEERPFDAWIWPREPWTLVTDAMIQEETRSAFTRRGVEVLVVEAS